MKTLQLFFFLVAFAALGQPEDKKYRFYEDSNYTTQPDKNPSDWIVDEPGYIHAFTEHGTFFKNPNYQTTFGVEFEKMLGDKFSLTWGLSATRKDDKTWFLNTPAGVLLGPLIALSAVNSPPDESCYTDQYGNDSCVTDRNSWGWFGLIAIIAPDGIAYHFQPTGWIDIAPYIKPLAMNWQLTNNEDNSLIFNYRFMAGVRFSFQLSEGINAYLNTRIGAVSSGHGGFWGIGAGISISPWILE